ncbi:MAG: ABC transporter permease, partial [Alistipes sp.]
PILMIALMAAPALIMRFAGGETKRIAVIDESGLILPQLESTGDMLFEPTTLELDSARKELVDHFGVLWVGADVMTNPNNVKLYANSSSSLSIEGGIGSQIEDIIEEAKLKTYNIENLSQILDEVKTTVTIQTFRNDESQEEDSQAKSSAFASVVGIAMGMLLYMFLLIYGAMVMQSVIE